MDYTWHYDSPLGGITLASDGEALVGVWFDGQNHFAAGLDPVHEERRLPVFDDACRWLDIYFSGRVPDFTPKLKLRTTAFRRKVWEILLTIPYGATMTYGEIADRLGGSVGVGVGEGEGSRRASTRAVGEGEGPMPMSARAVGSAVGHNPISLIIPCHRVVGSRGTLTGYAAGLDRKERLLRMERG